MTSHVAPQNLLRSKSQRTRDESGGFAAGHGQLISGDHRSRGSSSAFTYSICQGPLEVSWITVSPSAIA